jgi:hypothetical protein
MNVEAPNVVQDPLRHLYVRALIRTVNQIAGLDRRAALAMTARVESNSLLIYELLTQ